MKIIMWGDSRKELRSCGLMYTNCYLMPADLIFSILTACVYVLREAIRFKMEQRMEGARKDRHMTQNTMPHLVAQ